MVHTANLHSLGSKLLARYKNGKSFKVNKTCKMHKIRHHEGGLLSQELKCCFWGGPMLGVIGSNGDQFEDVALSIVLGSNGTSSKMLLDL